ncbi:MAG: hypothetical protein AB4352_28445 [Hormoscilla sp.]
MPDLFAKKLLQELRQSSQSSPTSLSARRRCNGTDAGRIAKLQLQLLE